MNTDGWDESTNAVTHAIIGGAQRVSNVLGCGFLEKVYENALSIELRKKGLNVEQQREIEVFYEGKVVGHYVADLLVEGTVVVELKAAVALDRVHRAQCINYLRATKRRLCLLMNFGRPRLEVVRIAL